MLAYIILSILFARVSGQTCNATLSTGPVINGTCLGTEFVDTANQLCCNSTGLITSTTTNSTCVDLLNPRTGVSDCPARAALCSDSTYYSLMTVQCPRTCGRCSTNGTTTNSTSCVDLTNPATGTSDCPSRAYLCDNSVYRTLMTQQCPRTCGRCTTTATSTSSTSTCVDRTNPSTGTSDCPRLAYLCTNSAYTTLMRTQCPLTCGFCSG